jgi:hypothetical protein
MAVIINLKEIFATDSQVEVSSKVNFNFNQLIALGIGGAGPTGATGSIGPAGPIGPIGPAGPTGSVIYGTTPVTAASSAPSGVPTNITIGDILITADRILKRVSTSGSNIYGWEVLTDFNSIVQTALGTNISPYVRLGATSRIVKPRVTAGLDLTNSVTSTDPNFVIPGLGTNYQTVLYNFNELKTRSLSLVGSNIAGVSNSSTEVSFNASSSAVVSLTNNQITVSAGHGLSTGQFVTYSNEGGTSIGGLTNNGGYYVYVSSSTVFSLCETSAHAIAGTPVIDFTSLGALNSGSPHKFITYPASIEGIFPQTSNLAVYSFFNSTASAAKEFETDPSAKGYRGQIELGSLDTLSTSYNGITSQNFLISPSFENLRIRKYRIGGFSLSGGTTANPGNYMLRAEYDLSSSGSEVAESFSPRRNSEHLWKINKAGTSQSVGRTIEMKFTNEHILANTESTAVAAGVSVDGLFFKRLGSFGGGLAANYFGIGFNPANNNSIDFDAPSGVTFNFNQNIVLGGGVTSTLKSNGIDFSSGTAMATWTVSAVNGNLRLQTSNVAATISLNNAVVVKENRLAQGLPFPITQVASTDANTLDDYEEGTWTPTLFGGSVSELGTTSSFDAICTGTAGRLAGYAQPATCWLNTDTFPTPTYVETTGLYGGANSNSIFRTIPITTEYARYVKIGKKVTCWVNFTISPEFNWILGTYSGDWANATLSPTAVAGTDASRFDILYAVNGTWQNSPAIGLTLPFEPANVTDNTPVSFSLVDDSLDVFSGTVQAGTFYYHIDDNPYDTSGYGPSTNYPIVLEPALYQNPIQIVGGVRFGGDINKNGIPAPSPIPTPPTPNPFAAIAPITPTSKCEIRIGKVMTAFQFVTTGNPPFTINLPTSYSASAALFFAQRDWIENAGDVASDTRSAGTSRLSPVTAIDCLYSSLVPTDGFPAYPDSVWYNKAIRFQSKFEYETAT